MPVATVREAGQPHKSPHRRGEAHEVQRPQTRGPAAAAPHGRKPARAGSEGGGAAA